MALIAVVFLWMQTSSGPQTEPELANMNAQDYEVMVDLDDLLASDDSSSLDESVFL